MKITAESELRFLNHMMTTELSRQVKFMLQLLNIGLEASETRRWTQVYIQHVTGGHVYFPPSAYITHGALPLRAICDMHRFSVAFEDMDKSYIEGELKRLEILEFARKMEKLTDVCFRGAPPDEDATLLLEFYSRENMLGTTKRNALSRAALNSEKNPALGLFKSRLHSLFAPMSFMKEQFSVLEKYPFLLPIYRVKRLAIMTKRYRADRYRRNYDKLSADELKEMQDVLKAAGINENHF